MITVSDYLFTLGVSALIVAAAFHVGWLCGFKDGFKRAGDTLKKLFEEEITRRGKNGMQE